MKFQHRAKKSLGQNFLVDGNYQKKIVEALQSALPRSSAIIEIGPGEGAITNHILDLGLPVFLCEKDRHFAAKWRETCRDQKHVTVIEGDFLKTDLSVFPQNSLVVSNLPYNVSTQILLKLLRDMKKFTSLTLMFQKEVALRCVGTAGENDYSVLGIWCEILSVAKKLFDVPPTAFRPQPKITSSIVEFLPSENFYNEEVERFMTFVKKVFGQRRKKIGSILKLKTLGDVTLDEMLHARAEDLPVKDLRRLFHQASKASNLPS